MRRKQHPKLFSKPCNGLHSRAVDAHFSNVRHEKFRVLIGDRTPSVAAHIKVVSNVENITPSSGSSAASGALPMSRKAICTSPEWQGRPDCVNCAVRKTVLFADLDESVLSDMLASVGNYHYEPGVDLCRQGDPATALYSLRRGVVKLEMSDGNGDASILRLLGPGAVIGLETTLGSGEIYHCTATALSMVDACRIPLQAFQRLMRDHPEHYKVIVRLWKSHLEAADEALLGFRSGELRERLAAILNSLSRFAGDSKSFTLPSGRDLSALTGATPVAISRVMADFKRQGVLRETGDKEFLLHDGE